MKNMKGQLDETGVFRNGENTSTIVIKSHDINRLGFLFVYILFLVLMEKYNDVLFHEIIIKLGDN